jgi:hypothetical protein
MVASKICEDVGHIRFSQCVQQGAARRTRWRFLYDR